MQTIIIILAVLLGPVAIVLLACHALDARSGRRTVIPAVVEVLNVKAGDSVVVTYPGLLTREQRAVIAAGFGVRLPLGATVTVLDGGLQLSHVVRSHG